MIRRVGWSTATTRSKGNHSSRWTYSKGASARASVAPLSAASRAPGIAAGPGGMCACGPQAAAPAKARPTARRQTK